MNNSATIEKMNQMKFYGMSRAMKSVIENNGNHNYTADELIAHLIDVEWDERTNRKIHNRVKLANFRYKAMISEIDFSLSRNLDKNIILRLSDCSWIRDAGNIILTGATGVGKSFMACALGHQACINGFKVSYYQCSKLFSLLKYYREETSYLKKMEMLSKCDVLILDDFGIHHFEQQSRMSLLEMVEDRYCKKPTIIVSQLPVANWHEIIGDNTIADAVLDRLVHNSYKIELKGESVRKIYGKNLD